MKLSLIIVASASLAITTDAFVVDSSPSKNTPSSSSISSLAAATTSSNTEKSKELALQKKKLFELLGNNERTNTIDSVLVDPITKESLQIESPGVLLGDGPSRINYKISSPSNKFQGSSDTFINLLEPVREDKSTSSSSSPLDGIMKQALPYVPPPLRGAVASLAGSNSDYIPMRDLFTSPAVSYAYERGWRQGFAQAGFPGPDVEAEMAMDYFAPVVARTDYSVVVDMSCATGTWYKLDLYMVYIRYKSHILSSIYSTFSYPRIVYKAVCLGGQIQSSAWLRLFRIHVDRGPPSHQC